MQEKAFVEVAVCINLEAWHLASNCWLWKGVGVVNLDHYQTYKCQLKALLSPTECNVHISQEAKEIVCKM
jgi:hypothetical protein